MSEPQLPQREGTQTHAGQSGSVAAGNSVAPRGGEALGPLSFDSLAAAGARLTRLREAKSWSIDDVSARLKVSPAKMRALEAGDISRFSGTTFALGVVRSYAKMLGVDPAPFAQALRREKGEPEPDLSMPASTGTDLPRGRVSVTLGGTQQRRSWWWGIAALAVALIALVMWHSGGEPPAWLARMKASANSAVADSSGSSTTAVNGQAVASGVATVAGNTVSDGNAPAAPTTAEAGGNAEAPGANPAPAGTAPATASSVERVVPPQAAAPQASAVTAAPQAAAVAQASNAAEPSQAPQSAEASGTAGAQGTATVAFAVTRDSWFSVRDKSGKEVFSGIVHAGDTKEVTGEQPFKVVAGNRAGIESITFDGNTVDAAKYATSKGNVSRFSLP